MTTPLKDDFAERARLEARLLSRRRRPDVIPSLPRPAGAPLRFAASLGQEGLWAGLAGNPRQSLIAGGVRLQGPLDAGMLRAAWASVTARHETLRSAYRAENGALTQLVSTTEEGSFEVLDADRRTVESAGDEEQARPFPFDQGPPARLRLLRLAPEDHVVVLCLHHLVGDARAMQVATRELCAHYAATAADGASPLPVLPRLPLQYADFAAWHRARTESEHGARTIDHWLRRLDGAEPAVLPTDRAEADAVIAGNTFSVPLPARTFEALREVAGRHRTTFYVVGLTAFQSLLARWSGQRDICVRAPVSYRDRSEVHDLIADFSNDVVLRTALAENVTWAQAVDQVRATTETDLAHHDVPPHLVAARMADTGLLDRLFHVQFTAESEHDLDDAQRLGGLLATPFALTHSTVARPLSMRLRHDANGARLIVAHRTGLVSEQRARRLQRDWFGLLEEMASRPDDGVFGGPWRRAHDE